MSSSKTKLFSFFKKNFLMLLVVAACIFLLYSQWSLREAGRQQKNGQGTYFAAQRRFERLTQPETILPNKIIDSVVSTRGQQLFLYLENTHCGACTDSLWSNARYLTDKWGKGHLTILISPNFSMTDFQMYKRLNAFTLENIFYTSRVSRLDTLGQSYYFFLSSQHASRGTSVFLADPLNQPADNWRYLHWLTQTFFQKQ